MELFGSIHVVSGWPMNRHIGSVALLVKDYD
jgi:hypothetical protein